MLYKKHLLLLLLIIISLIPLLDLLHPGLPITHDGQDHVARIANFYQSLSEGNIIPRWAANLNWGYGHPILMFLYPLPSYFTSLFHVFGFSLMDSIKIVFAGSFILSGVFMYLWIKEWLGDKAAFIAGLFYMVAPYRFIDLYVRGAIGEHVAFVFLPLIMYFMIKLSKRISWWYIVGASFSFAFLILSHNAVSIMFLPPIFLYAMFLLWQEKEKKQLTICYLVSVILGLGLSTFFWSPAYFEGKYTLRDIVTVGEYATRFVNFQDFLFGKWSYGISGEFSVQIGFLHWIMVIGASFLVVYLHKRKNKFWFFSLGTVLIFWLTLFLMTRESSIIWQNLSILQKFQFPWRFLSISVFTASVLGGLVLSTIPRKVQGAVAVFVVILLLIANKNYWYARDYLIKSEDFFSVIYHGTTDTGESSPIWSVRFMEKEPSARIEAITGEGTIKELRRNTTVHNYDVYVTTSKARIRENTVYFPGWEVLVDGRKTTIEFQDPANRGLITFFLDQGEHIVSVVFKDTKLRLFSNFISSLALLFIVLYSIIRSRKLWQRFR